MWCCDGDALGRRGWAACRGRHGAGASGVGRATAIEALQRISEHHGGLEHERQAPALLLHRVRERRPDNHAHRALVQRRARLQLLGRLGVRARPFPHQRHGPDAALPLRLHVGRPREHAVHRGPRRRRLQLLRRQERLPQVQRRQHGAGQPGRRREVLPALPGARQERSLDHGRVL